MTLPRLVKTQSFRLTALSALLFSLAASLVFGLMYWTATQFMDRQMDNTLLAEMRSLQENGGDDLASLVERRLEAPSTREFLYLLRDASGRRVAGNMPPMAVQAGWQDLHPPGTQTSLDDDDHMLRALGKTLPDGSLLVVARDAGEIDEVADFMENSVMIGFAVTLLIAFASGALVSAGFLRRLDAVTRTARNIMAGDLHHRIPVKTGADDFDSLALSLNAMLDRIVALMEGIQQVSNDIAHDMRTPLARLRQGLERARFNARTKEDFQTSIDAALGEADRLLEMFGALLRIARIESGTQSADFSIVDLSAVIRTVFDVYLPVAEDCEHTLTVSAQPDVPVRGDHQLLTQMLVNLVENALRHTPAGSTVAIDLGRDPATGVARLTVADDGPGIPVEERTKVFRRFYRLDSSRSTDGSGLGLSMVAAIVALHRGAVTLEDNAPGVRATVLFFPNAGGPSSERAVAKTGALPSGPREI